MTAAPMTAANPFPKAVSEDTIAILLKKSARDLSSDCLEWTGAINSAGYGVVWLPRDQKTYLAHRVALGIERDRSGLVVDHLCRNTCCIEPVHLEIVTQAVNVQRGDKVRLKESATHCPQGHLFADTAFWNANGYRECGECKRFRNAQRSPR